MDTNKKIGIIVAIIVLAVCYYVGANIVVALFLVGITLIGFFKPGEPLTEEYDDDEDCESIGDDITDPFYSNFPGNMWNDPLKDLHDND